MLLRKSQLARVNTLYRQSLALWREIGDRRGTAEVLNNLGDLVRVDLNDRVSGRGFMLTGLYVSVVLFGWPLILMSALGLIETMAALRARVAARRAKPPSLNH